MKPKLLVLSDDPKAYTWGAWAGRKYNQLVERLERSGQKAGRQSLVMEGFTILLSYAGGLGKIIILGGPPAYVGVAMPNPTPYRGVSLGVPDLGQPSYTTTSVYVAVPGSSQGGGESFTQTFTYTFYNSAGDIVGTSGGSLVRVVENLVVPPGSAGVYLIHTDTYNNVIGDSISPTGMGCGQEYPPGGLTARWKAVSGTYRAQQEILENPYGVLTTCGAPNSLSWSAASPSYESILAADIAAGIGGKGTYVVASDGVTLAFEAQNTAGGVVSFEPGSYTWSGGGYVDMFTQNGSAYTYNHKLTFTVPEDCVYPITEAPPPYPGAPANPDSPRWIADWAAGVAAAKARRVAWFKKNSGAVLDQLKAGTFVLPASWDYQIKRQCPVSSNTRRQIIMSATFVGAVVSPFGTLGTAVGSTTSESSTRTTTLTYTVPVIQPDGSSISEVRTETIVGTLLKIKTRVVEYNTTSEQHAYFNWYVSSGASLPPGVTSTAAPRIQHQFLTDTSASGWGLFWSGVVTAGSTYFSNSAFSVPTAAVAGSVRNALPGYVNTLVGAAPQFMLTYHGDVLPEYTAPVPPAASTGSTTFNDSAMYGIKTVTLIPFGLVKAGESLGMFADPSDAAGSTEFEYYGTATYGFDWQTGQLTFRSWSPLTDSDGNVVASKKAPLPVGAALPAYNVVVKYSPLTWEDVKVAAAAAKSARADGQGDRALAEILASIA